ncbi:RusA family crossover junction endodeoxyribonuclease, partial [Escherichia coli]|nr:RusA family crossover junction endodeoxyribonuclease [Escherichia coli]
MAKYSITPLGKPRMTRADKWKQRPPVLRYRVFCDEVRLSGITLP